MNVPDLSLFNHLRDSGGIQKTVVEANGTISGHELDIPDSLVREDLLRAATCRAKNKLGEQCRAIASRDGFCSMHSHAGRAAELGRRSGESRKPAESEPIFLLPPKTACDLHKALGQIFAMVASGRMDSDLGRTLGYIGSVLLKTTELSDLEVRLGAIEQIISSVKRERTGQ